MAGDDEKRSVFGDQAGSVALLWGGGERPSRGPKPALNLERITLTAIGLADTGGLGAVSMQRVAAELDFTKMSLYRYVPGKSELVALMIDRAMGEPPSPPSPDAAGRGDGEPWRVALRAWAHALAAVHRRHPWLLGAAVGPRVMGPNELGWTERALAALTDTGLTGAEQLDAVVVVSGHIRAIAQVASSMGLGSTRAREPEQVMSAALNELLAGRAARVPAGAAAVAATEADSASRDQAGEFGLERILDGLAAYMSRARGVA
ncbi:TetR/AcrR family transcriptional regulator [Streptomyces nigrescens]|uniref:TetR/AcrR family transcriptional regulator n=1 Tax=Streptomyces nigrescens TaxID=1920 RepID=UPI0022583170|nr:TetR/AcrR family transcriptional regulator C-terminal domain-containing protein [Streptomyces libani]MCX5447278.1 TetR/AcrR family transcriptional regulator C-terminal domain-containing protein [Streptomyces libani]